MEVKIEWKKGLNSRLETTAKIIDELGDITGCSPEVRIER